MRPVFVTAVFVGLVVAAAHAAFTPAKDVPYREHVAFRFTDKGAPAVTNEAWAVLPTAGVYDVAIGELELAGGSFMLSPDGLYWLPFNSGAAATISRLPLSGAGAGQCGTPSAQADAGQAKCSLVVYEGALVALVAPTGVYYVKCTKSGCTTTSSVKVDLGTVNSTAITSSSPQTIWVGSANGLWVVPSGGTSASLALPDSIWSVAYSDLDDLVAAGNSEKLYYFDATAGSKAAQPHRAAVGPQGTLAPLRWEWVTEVSTGSGGAVDDIITGMAFDSSGVLYIANPTCLNIRARNGSISRLAGLEGLPYNQLRAVAVGSGVGANQLWLASDMGASMWDQNPDASDTWRYFFGARYHPGTAVVDVATSDNFTVLATDGGVALIEAQLWTLAEKAAHMETILERHNRLVGPPGLVGGLAADCSLASFGNALSCHNHDSDNNGLWTSLVVAAEAMRYAVTKDQDALTKAVHFFAGMRFLNLVTGVRGLMARSVVKTGTPHQTNRVWHNSTAYPGWTWKGDTSSDEVTGHMFAYPIVKDLVSNATAVAEAEALINDIATYLVKNNFTLIDVTGKPTTWGHWDPATINGNRAFSDGRGVQSLQILAFLSSAFELNKSPLFTAAFSELTNAANQYLQNMLNLKIEAPCDDNYSDDELTFLPYYTRANAAADAPFNNLAPMLASMNRTFGFVKRWRSDLWNAFTVAITGDGDSDTIDSIVWNLRTWPLSFVDWPVTNSHRTDIQFRPGPNRQFQTHTDSVRVLPANERNQYRWNSDPHDLDGGSGTSECDPGAWLLPYWLARYHKIIV